jgi:PhnB protein
MAISISPYIKFNGNCKDAMAFYKECFEGELYMRKFAESPMACLLSSEVASKISLGVLQNKSFVINSSDLIGQRSRPGNSVCLFVACENETELKTVFDQLSQEGEIILPMHQTYWGSIHGEIADRFGIQWTLNCSKKKNN